MVNQSHPYYTLAVNMYPKLVNKYLMTNQISQMEANVLLQKLNGPEFSQFIQNLINQLPTINGEPHMETLVRDNFISRVVGAIRQQNAMMYGAGGMMPYGAGQPMMYGPGGYPMNPGMTGWASQQQPGSSWYTGNNPGTQPTRFGSAPVTPVPAGSTLMKPSTTDPAAPSAQEPKKTTLPAYKEPELLQDRSINHQLPNSTAFARAEFIGFDGAPVVEVYAVDNRPIYVSCDEVIRAYSNLLGDSQNARKFLTVCYNELKVLEADRNAVQTLMKAVATAVGNINVNDLDKKIRTAITVCNEHPSGAVTAFEKLVLDEYHAHVFCGELASKNNERFAVTVKNMSQLHDILTNNLPKETRDALKAMPGFEESFRRIVAKVINTTISSSAAAKILDPLSDKTILDVYGKAVPPIWNNPTSGSWESTDSLFIRYLSSIKTIDGHKPESAVSAEQHLRGKLLTLDKNFTVFQVPRIITWCNSPSSSVVGWAADGTCVPTVYSDKIDNDIAFFLRRALERTDKSSQAQKDAPTRVVCEVDEGKIQLEYGLTCDSALWVGSVKYTYK
jgi:hypothetical protein